MNLLEEEAERLKSEYGARWHKTIESNLRWVSEEMRNSPSSIAIQEGMIALSRGLPLSNETGPKKKKVVRRRRASHRKNQPKR